MHIERNRTGESSNDDALRRQRQAFASAAALALDRMRAIAEEADPVNMHVTTATALFALSDMARARMFRGTRVFDLLEEMFAGRWSRLATERARYIAGRATDLDERPVGMSRLSANARHALAIARMLAGRHPLMRPLMVEDIVLGLLLCTPLGDEPVAAHGVLQRLDLSHRHLLESFGELARA